jgi:phosphoglycolate phosphatase-like HAD superfamily hydrolase
MISTLAVIFDLDGTLVDTDAFDGALYIETVREVVGDVDVDDSWRRCRNVTDAGVLAQILEESGLSDADHLKVRVRDVFGSKIQRHLVQGGRCKCTLESRSSTWCSVPATTVSIASRL